MLYLLPAQLDIRQIGPGLPDVAQFEALRRTANGPVSVSAIRTSSQESEVLSLGHHTVVIEWADGRLMLIDAGMDAAAARDFGRLMEWLYGAQPAEVHTTAVRELGDRLQDVAAIGFTHLHIDHTQGAVALCANNPRMKVVQTNLQRTTHNVNTTEGAAIVAGCRQADAIDADTLTELADFPGVGIYSLGGHTPGSTLFAVAVEERILLFSGDITNSKTDLVEDTGKGFAYSYLVVPENTDRTAELRLWLHGLDQTDHMSVYVSHDIGDMEGLAPFRG